LIADDEATRARVGIVHKDVTDFSTEWFRLIATSDKFQLSTLQGGHDEELRDLGVGTFEVLTHSPVRALGINGSVHFLVESADEWHRIGHSLVPKGDVWDEVLSKPGTRMVAVQGTRTDGYKGSVLVRVGPSQVAQQERGIWLDVNDHFLFEPSEPASGAEVAVKALQTQWDSCKKRFEQIRDRMMRL
jgi:hypothetical protein